MMKKTITGSTPPSPNRFKTYVKTLIAILVSAAPMVVMFIEQTELDTQIKAAGYVSGCLTALIYSINNPTGRTFIDRFMPWLLDDNQKEALEEYVGKRRKE
jgi:hypothetical protein